MGAVLGLLKQLRELLPTPVFVALVVLLILAGLPAWMRSIRTKQLRSQARRVARAGTAVERRAAEDAALALADGKGLLLVALADESLKLNQRALALRVLTVLEETGASPADLPRLRREIHPEKPVVAGHPLELAVAVRRLVDEGLVDVARERLSQGLARYPDDPDLQTLARDLAAGGSG